jgi:PKD repeat protein
LVETCLTAGGGLTFTAGSGFTQAVTDPTNRGSSTEYQVAATVQSGLTVTQSFSSSHTWLSLATALKAVNGTTWSASNGNASVNASGLARGISAGTTTIQACIGGICGSTTLTVTSGTGGGTPPTAVISANPTSGTAALTVAFSGSGSTDPDGTITSYAWNFGDGQTSSAESPSHGYAVVGAYTVKLTVTDNAGRQGSTTTAITVSAPATYAGVYRIIAGGGPYTDSQQQVWQADAGFNTGNVTTTGAAISGTTDPALYQHERWDAPGQAQLEYELPVANGTYFVNLYFAETDAASEGVGQRVFGVDFQGVPAITNLDIYGTVGANTALVKGAVVTVNNGTLTIDFVRGVGNPKIDAIEVREVSSHDLALPKSSWNVSGEDGLEDIEDDTLNGSALNAIDNNASTFWMTRITTNNQGAPPNYPHDLQIDLGKSYPLSGFQYLPRQDGSTQGMIGQYSFSVSADGVSWGSPAASGRFSATALQTQVSFTPVNARYVDLEGLSDVNGNTTTSAAMAELGILFACSATPSVVITAPVDEYLQSSGASLTATAYACLDPVQNVGWGVQFTLDGGSPINVHMPPFQATFTNLSKAEHVIDAYVINSSGAVVSATGPTHDKVKQIGIGDYYVTIGDSVNWGEFGVTVTSTDGRDTGSGYGPLLNNQLTSFKGYPQHVANEAVPGTTAAEGLEALPSILKKEPNSQTFLLNFGMNDSDYWLPIPSGEGLSPGNSGYAGSYKDSMQQIINQVNAAGKHVALGKTIVALADCPDSTKTDPGYCPPYPNLNTGAKNVLIQQYNEVMNELVANSANRITVTPPDFYTFFSSPYPYPSEYHNWWHPNQTGYQDMSQLWFQALTQ